MCWVRRISGICSSTCSSCNRIFDKGKETVTKTEKLLIVLLMGSIWGALELFGIDLLRAMHVPSKTAFLFGLGLILVYASKRVVDFKGSVIIMALIAGLFKTVSDNFFACQFSAVVINGIVFDLTYTYFKNYLDNGILYRLIAAPIIAYVSYTAFAFFTVYLLQEPHWVERGMSGIIDYLATDALIASLISIVTIDFGYKLGNVLQQIWVPGKVRMPSSVVRVGAIVLVAAIWIAGQMY
jgi:hypothetical protein